nr:ATP-binding cassette domain-containing protein [Streptomyces sp. HGB0020]
MRGLRFLWLRRGVLLRLVCWSVLETVQTFLTGYAPARALDAGFLAGRADVGLAWLGVAGLGVVVGAYGTGRVYAAVASLVEPLRDRLVEGVVERGVRRADGGALSGLTQQVEIARETFAGLVMVSRSFVFTAVGALVGLFSLAPMLLAAVGPPLVAGVVLFVASLRPLARRQEAFLVADEALAERLGEVCPGLRDITATGAEEVIAADVGVRVDAELSAARALARWGVVRVSALALGGHLPIVLLLATAPWLLAHGVTAGALVGALAYVTQSLLPALTNLVHGLGTSGSRLTVVLRRLAPASMSEGAPKIPAPESEAAPDSPAPASEPAPKTQAPASEIPAPRSAPAAPAPATEPGPDFPAPTPEPAPETAPTSKLPPPAPATPTPTTEPTSDFPAPPPTPKTPTHSPDSPPTPKTAPTPETPAPATPTPATGPAPKTPAPATGLTPDFPAPATPAIEPAPNSPAPPPTPKATTRPPDSPAPPPEPPPKTPSPTPEPPPPTTEHPIAPAPTPTLSLTSVTFAYGPDATPVMKDLDLTLAPGSHLAVVGPSGIGKSTLTALIAGVLEPRCGRIRVGGVPVPSVEAARHRVLIPQEAYVFTGTVADNLAHLRQEPVPERELVAAADAVGLGPLLARLGGLGAEVDPAALSAGERQLIALTRAYLSYAPLALLDEATCHLDPQAEERAERAFARRPGGTLVVVAHRISSARRADRVLVMDGRGTAYGTHDELLKTSPLYRELVGNWGPPTPSQPAFPLRDADRVDAVAGPGLAGDGRHVVAHGSVGKVEAAGDLRDRGALGGEG